VSKVETAPPQASKPSRAALLIWAGIAAFCLTMFGSALALFLWSRTAFDSKDLKTATSVRITYLMKSPTGTQSKSVVVSDPAELAALLGALEITHTDMSMQFWSQKQATIDFTLANGKVAHVTFPTPSPTQLNRESWGQVYVTPKFREKVNEIISKEEKRPIDIQKEN
jgi:hypothetical protein